MNHFSIDTSPFATVASEEPWLLWKADEPLSALCEADTADSSVPVHEMPAEYMNGKAHEASSLQPHIKRPQYQAVLSKMQQATMRTGAYSAWSS